MLMLFVFVSTRSFGSLDIAPPFTFATLRYDLTWLLYVSTCVPDWVETVIIDRSAEPGRRDSGRDAQRRWLGPSCPKGSNERCLEESHHGRSE